MAMGFTIVAAHIVGIVTESSLGLSLGEDAARRLGARTTSYFLVVSIAGRLLGGYLAERFPKRGVITVELLALITAALVLLRLQNMAGSYVELEYNTGTQPKESTWNLTLELT